MTRPYKRVSHNRIFGLENSIVPQHSSFDNYLHVQNYFDQKTNALSFETCQIQFHFHIIKILSFWTLLPFKKGRSSKQNINENPYEALALFISLYSPIIQSSSFVIAIWTQFGLSRSCRRISTPVLFLFFQLQDLLDDVITQLRSFQPRFFCYRT